MKVKLPIMVERVIADTRILQTQMTQEFNQKLALESQVPSCRVGCANCCHHPFYISMMEGLLLYRWLVAHGRWNNTLRDQIKEVRNKVLGLPFEVWLMSNIACPLLTQEKKCLAYEARPLHCSLTYSVGDPEQCHPHELSTATGLVPHVEEIMAFNSSVAAKVKRLEIWGALMPLSEVLLLAEGIETGQLDIETFGVQFVVDISH